MGTLLGAAVNSDPGSPSDDEDLPHPSSSLHVTCGPSPTGSDEGSPVVNGSCYYVDNGVWREPRQMGEGDLLPVALGGHTHRQMSLNDYLDSIETPRMPGDLHLAGPSPKLRSSFPTDTRLNAMLHIDSDEDEETHRDQSQEVNTQQSTDSSSTRRPGRSESEQGDEGSNREPQSEAGGGAGAEAGSSSGAEAEPNPAGDAAVAGTSGASEAAARISEPGAASTEMVHTTQETPTIPCSSQPSVAEVGAVAGPLEPLRESACQEQIKRTSAIPDAACRPTPALLPLIQVRSCKFKSKSKYLAKLDALTLSRRWRPGKR